MAKLTVSLLLVFTQFLSWNAAPVYLCICDKDTVCLDGGPDDCNCCHEDADEHHATADNRQPADRTTLALTSECDCRHVELSLAGPVTLVRGADHVDGSNWLALPCPAIFSPSLVAADQMLLRAPPGEQTAADIYASTILGSVTLRC
jgi:hypothetical protein